MKRNFLLLFFAIISAGVFAQGKSQEQKNKDKSQKSESSVKKNSTAKSSKNIPTKVSAAFKSDYPGATSPVWTKSQGNWTVTFGNGIYSSVATYHANGERRDTQTPVLAKQAPRSVWDEILKRYPGTSPNQNLLKLEKPGHPVVFQFQHKESGKSTTISFDEAGNISF